MNEASSPSIKALKKMGVNELKKWHTINVSKNNLKTLHIFKDTLELKYINEVISLLIDSMENKVEQENDEE